MHLAYDNNLESNWVTLSKEQKHLSTKSPNHRVDSLHNYSIREDMPSSLGPRSALVSFRDRQKGRKSGLY
jgi:hypothetical protein